jgi:uncharacterized protein (TIGR03435 family)
MKLAGMFMLMAALAASQERLTFEVSSIKPTPADARSGGIKALPGGQTYQARGVPVKLIFSLMYKVPMRQISGGPSWLDSDRWDIDAKAAHPYNLDDLHTMFQNLLADEFQIKFHKEVKEGPVYALTIDKSGSKMKLNESPQDFEIPIQGNPSGEIIGKRVPMNYFSWWLGQVLQRDSRPVLDRTGLDKFYDFKLSFAPELPPGVDTSNLPAGMMDRPTIFVALKEQLGLRLDAQRGPVEYYVIDSAVKPAAN